MQFNTGMIKINPISENALACVLPPPAGLDKQQKLWAFAESIEAAGEAGEVVVGMNNLTVFSPYGTDLPALSRRLERLWQHIRSVRRTGRHVEIPVVYGGEYGMDLAAVARYHGVPVERIVREHTGHTYTVFMMGFQPGFPYLGGLPEHLHTPRHAVPRTRVEAGSVGIGGAQTGVYPFASPGGWQILGRTSMALFDAAALPPAVLRAGDSVRFAAERIEP